MLTATSAAAPQYVSAAPAHVARRPGLLRHMRALACGRVPVQQDAKTAACSTAHAVGHGSRRQRMHRIVGVVYRAMGRESVGPEWRGALDAEVLASIMCMRGAAKHA